METSLSVASIYMFCALCFIQRTQARKFAAGVFALIYLAHYIAFNKYGGFMYYGTDAIFNLVIIFLLYKSQPATSLGLDLQFVCFASIVINAIGYVLWFSYMDPVLYNWAFVMLHFYAVYCLTRKERHYGDSEIDSSIPFLRSYFNLGS